MLMLGMMKLMMLISDGAKFTLMLLLMQLLISLTKMKMLS